MIAATAPCIGFSTVFAANLVINGGFEGNGGVGQLVSGYSYATGWDVGADYSPSPAPFAFIVNAQADDSGFPTIYGTFSFWGPGNGYNNGFTGGSNGGDFLGVDGGYGTATMSQTISGLTPGAQYTLSFEWAVAQLNGFYGDYLGKWDVTFGSDSASTPMAYVNTNGFSPWAEFSHTFTATSTTEVLGFRAFGSQGLGAYPLLDNVSLVATSPVPEPGTTGALMLLFSSLLGVRQRIR